ncbi:hypothetical protein WJX77_007533 [Trebouxia sp. C0004]
MALEVSEHTLSECTLKQLLCNSFRVHKLQHTQLITATLSALQGLSVAGEAKLLVVLEDGQQELHLLRSDRAARDTVATSVAFSSVSGTEANRLLEELQLTEVDGFAAAPVEPPAGAGDIAPFDFSKFVNEDAAASTFVEYHKEQLQSCGVRMGRSGYAVHDLHKAPLYNVQIGGRRYEGGVDGGMVPYTVQAASATKLLRIGFEHKQPTEDKATFRLNNPDVVQAYHALADFLIKQGTLSLSKHIIADPPHQLEETLLRPIKKL